ncbi:MAG: hypothetical protein K2Q26_04250 [Bdellovibrionales bacterium]|nr:hypothetical protein [Bdellovibrionales bacterium]
MRFSIYWILIFFSSGSSANDTLSDDVLCANSAIEVQNGNTAEAANCIRLCSVTSEHVSYNTMSRNLQVCRSAALSSQETNCIAGAIGPHTGESAKSCVDTCNQALPTALDRNAVQEALRACTAQLGNPTPRTASTTPTTPADRRREGTPDEAATPRPDPQANTAATPRPTETPQANAPNPFGAGMAAGLGAASTPSIDINSDPSAIQFGQSGPQPNVNYASDAVGGGYGGGGAPAYSDHTPFMGPEGIGGGGRSGGGGGGNQPPAQPMGGGGGGGLAGGGGGVSPGGSKKGGPGGFGGSPLAQQLQGIGRNSFYGAGGSMSNPVRGAVKSTPPPPPAKYVKKTDESSQALGRLFGSQRATSATNRFSGFIPAGGMSCLSTIFCNVENYFERETRNPSSVLTGDSQP